MTRQDAEQNTILRCEVGSTAHGISIGNDDRDEMGVVIEPLEEALTLGNGFEQFIFRTATERTGQHDAPSQPGDLDLTLYSLKKYLRLASSGNPTVLAILFTRPLEATLGGHRLQALAPALVSRRAGSAFLGYMQAQRQKLLHERGGMKVCRPELETKFGFDTKFASHMLRLGIQGEELLQTGRFSVPMTEDNQRFIQSVRRGEVPLNDCVQRAGDLERSVKDLMDGGSPLQESPDLEAITAFLIDSYRKAWLGDLINFS